MARKPASMYRRLKGPAYTRRKYIGGVPNNRILNFYAGNRRAAETGEFLMELNLIADESSGRANVTSSIGAHGVGPDRTICDRIAPEGAAKPGDLLRPRRPKHLTLSL